MFARVGSVVPPCKRYFHRLHRPVQLQIMSISDLASADRLVGFDRPTVWHEFTPLANKHKAVNLGQGFPDWKSPNFVKQAMIDAISTDHNQYCRSAGEITLVNSLAAAYSEELGRKIDPLTEVVTSVGATECLFAIMQAFINSGDEVIMMEPAFDIYPAQVQMAGGVSVCVPMLPPEPATADTVGRTEWSFDVSAIAAAITPRTRIILLNTPHNPTGRVLSRSELEAIAELVTQHPRIIVVCDEVYERIVYSTKKHTHLASLPGMFERTITVSSSGKTFSVTGWKVGWAVGCSKLIAPIALANQWVQFSVSTPTQKAIGDILEVAASREYEGYASYYDYLLDMYKRKLEILSTACEDAGLIPLQPEGGFFLLCDTRNIELPAEYATAVDEITGLQYDRDWAFCRWLTKEIGVAAIPPSAFFGAGRKHYAANVIRLCFAKEDETLIEAGKRLQRLKAFIKLV